jgi:hypothetical protein
VGIPLLVSVIGLAVTVWWWYTGRPPFARHDTVTTTAVIEEVRQGPPLENPDGPKNYQVNATVRYVVHGADVRATVRLGMCPTPPCSLARQGQTISIGYDPRYPAQAFLAPPEASWQPPFGLIVLGVVGVACIAIAAVYVVGRYRWWRVARQLRRNL